MGGGEGGGRGGESRRPVGGEEEGHLPAQKFTRRIRGGGGEETVFSSVGPKKLSPIISPGNIFKVKNVFFVKIIYIYFCFKT
jgi:hypothetical protein